MEATGLVLRTLPLLISALKSYNSALSSVQSVRRKTSRIRGWIRSLEDIEVLFHSLLESFTEEELEVPVNARQLEVIERQARKILGTSYEAFVETIVALANIDQNLMRKLSAV